MYFDIQTDDGRSVLSTIDEKLKFLKQTLVCELDKMSVHPTTITPSQGHTLTTSTRHPHTLTSSTTVTTYTPSPLATDSHADPTPKQDKLHLTEKLTNTGEELESGAHGLQSKTAEGDTGREPLNVPRGKCGGRGDEDKREESAPRNDSSSGSTEPDSVQLISCSLEEMEREIASSERNVTAEGGRGENLEGEPRGGENEDGGSSSESDMEVPRGAVGGPALDISLLTDNRAVSPLTISPGTHTMYMYTVYTCMCS